MQPPQYTGFESGHQLVFAITDNPPLGLMIEPFAVKVIGDGQFSYEFHRLSPLTAGDFFHNMSQPYKQLLKVYGQVTEDTLLKRFNKDHKKPSLFFDQLTADFIAEHLRPLFDKTMAEMADLLFKHGIALHYKGLKDERIVEKQIWVAPGKVEPVFFFERSENGIRYRLELIHEGRELSLKGEDTRMLGTKPCLLKVDDRVFRFDKEWDGKKLSPFFTRDEIMVPKTSEKAYFQKFVLDAIRHHKVKAVGFEICGREESPRPVFKLEQNWQNHWTLQLSFAYGEVVFPFSEEQQAKVEMKQEGDRFIFIKVERDVAFEQEWAGRLKMLGLINKGGEGFYLWYPAKKTLESPDEPVMAGLYDYLDWLAAQREALGLHNIEVQQDAGSGGFFLGRPQVSLEVTDRNDWFDLYGTVSFGPHRIPFLRLKNHILQGIREFSLPDGSTGLIPLEWFEKYQDVMKFAQGKGNTLQLKRHHFTLLGKLKEASTPVKGLDEAMRDFSPPMLPQGIDAQLRPYQLQGFQWMSFLHQHHLGGCLADDMGLGKTLQTLVMLVYAHREPGGKNKPASTNEEAREKSEETQLSLFEAEAGEAPPAPLGTSLLVMPLSLIHNWMREIGRFTPQLRSLQHTGPALSTSSRAFLPYDLVLTTYGTVRNDIDMLEGFHFNSVVLDESQIIKNAESKIFNAIKKLKAGHRLVLTGTPVENSLTDLWAQFSFLNPGLLGNLNYFREEFVVPVEKSNDLRKQQKLHSLIEPFILRRTKSEVAKELPELTELVRYCEMSEEHRKFYEAKKSQIRNLILEQVEKQGMERSRFFILSSLMRLRLMANHPLMVDPEYAYDSGKFIEVRENIGKVLSEGHKVLIFSQFVKHLNIYRKYLDSLDLPYNLLTGQMPEKERGRLINDFQQDPEKRLFLISLKAGGLGLNLTGADYVFLLDPWWNPAVENQAINRAHRIGQKKNVFVYKFITRDTVEEKILSLQQRKSALAGLLIDQNNPLKNLGLDEISDLIT